MWPVGTLGTMPFVRNGNRAHGPGACDMKAGIALSIHALRIVAAQGLIPRGPITLLITSGEEIGSPNSRELIESLAAAHGRVFVVEPSRDDGAIKIDRKGDGGFWLDFHGRGAHAGNNPADGASALRELAHFLFFVEGLGDDEAQTTVNLTVARGGSVSNVITEEAHAQVDMRVLQLSEAERVEAAIQRLQPQQPTRVGRHQGRPQPPATRADRHQPHTVPGGPGEACRHGARPRRGHRRRRLRRQLHLGHGRPHPRRPRLLRGGPHARHEHIRIAETLERLALMVAMLTA